MRLIDADSLTNRKFTQGIDAYSIGWNDAIDAIIENEPTVPEDIMTTVHELKIEPVYYCQVAAGTKSFELRKDDREYKRGDELILREYHDGTYTGRHIRRKVRYILRDCPEYGLSPGYCILGF